MNSPPHFAALRTAKLFEARGAAQVIDGAIRPVTDDQVLTAAESTDY